MAERSFTIYPWRVVRWLAFGAMWAFPMHIMASVFGVPWDWNTIAFCIFVAVWTQIVDVVENAVRARAQGE